MKKQINRITSVKYIAVLRFPIKSKKNIPVFCKQTTNALLTIYTVLYSEDEQNA